jgi:imidazolonepropionase-like amidohydrolase
MIRKLFAASAMLAIAAAAVAQQARPPQVATVIHAGRLLADPSTGRVDTQRSILVGADGKVISIEAGYVTRPNAKVVELRNMFVLPGLIDSHVHLTSELGPNQLIDPVTKSESDDAFEGAKNAKKTVEAGFTTVADLGSDYGSAIFALRKAILDGIVPGPRIIAAGQPISAHGGHGDVNGYNDAVLEALHPISVCSGADDCRRAVRMQVQRGADVIKFMSTGGVLSNTAAGVGQQLTDDEMKAIVDTAHSMGRRATTHAHAAQGINAALRAGADSIEHGSYADDESMRLLKEKGAYLVPTLEAGWWVGQLADKGGTLTPAQADKARQVAPALVALARRAHDAGVKMAFGTDTGVSPHGMNAHEFVLLTQAGFTPLQAIQMATINAADHLQLNTVAGKIAPGFSADIIAVDGDPLQDVKQLEGVDFVMARGTVAKAAP